MSYHMTGLGEAALIDDLMGVLNALGREALRDSEKARDAYICEACDEMNQYYPEQSVDIEIRSWDTERKQTALIDLDPDWFVLAQDDEDE